jgi:hypothetical protein
VSICLPKTDPLYDPKLESFLEVLGYEAIDVTVPAAEIAGRVQQIWTSRQKFLEELSRRIAKLREGYKKNMLMVQRLLENFA